MEPRNENENENRHNIVVIGGGITGLAAAYNLQKQARQAGNPVSITLIERDRRLGGKIITQKEKGYTIEGGPDCFLRSKPWAAELCQEVGIADRLMGTNDSRRKVYITQRSRLVPLPDGVMLIIPTRFMPFITSRLISLPGKLRMGMDAFIPPYQGDGDESVADFVRRRLGREAQEKIAEPLLSGIHVSDPEKQSLLGTFPRFRKMEQEHGSLIRGMLKARLTRKKAPAPPSSNGKPSSLFITMQGGLGEFIQGVEAALDDVQVCLETTVTAIQRDADNRYLIHTDRGLRLAADAVILASPASDSARMLEGLDPHLAEKLAAVEYVSTATISVGFRRADITHPVNGFGYLTPETEGRAVSACTWTSTKFDHRAPEDRVLLRCFVGGPGKEEMVDLDDDTLRKIVLDDLREMMGIVAEPEVVKIFRWRNANPQYQVGHLARMEEIAAQTAQNPALFLAGSSYGGVGLPDCVRQGKEAAESALNAVAQRTQPAHQAVLSGSTQ